MTFQDSLEVLARESKFVSFATPRFAYPFPVPPIVSVPPPASSPIQPPTFHLTQSSSSSRLSWTGHKQKATPVLASVTFSAPSCSCSRCFGPEWFFKPLLLVSSMVPSTRSGSYGRFALPKIGTSLGSGRGEFAVGRHSLVGCLKSHCEILACSNTQVGPEPNGGVCVVRMQVGEGNKGTVTHHGGMSQSAV